MRGGGGEVPAAAAAAECHSAPHYCIAVTISACLSPTPACLPQEPWYEFKFEGKEGTAQLVVTELQKLGAKPGAKVEDLGAPDQVGGWVGERVCIGEKMKVVVVLRLYMRELPIPLPLAYLYSVLSPLCPLLPTLVPAGGYSHRQLHHRHLPGGRGLPECLSACLPAFFRKARHTLKRWDPAVHSAQCRHSATHACPPSNWRPPARGLQEEEDIVSAEKRALSDGRNYYLYEVIVCCCVVVFLGLMVPLKYATRPPPTLPHPFSVYQVYAPYSKTGGHNLAAFTTKGALAYLYVLTASDKQWGSGEATLRKMIENFQA